MLSSVLVRSTRRRRRTVTRAGAVALLGTVALVATACSSSGSPSSSGSGGSGALTTIRISNTAIVGDEVPLVYANATNLWAKFGLKVQMVNVTSSAQFAGLGAGQADIALGGAAGIEAAQKGAPEVVIGSIGRVRMDFLAQADITSVADLKGKTLGASSPGSLLGAGQQLYLQEKGLTTSDYKTVYTSGSFAATITALINKSTQASFAAHPFIDTAEAGNPGLHALARIDQSDIGILTANVATANSTWAAKNSKAVTQFFRAWAEASKEVKSNMSATVGYLASAAKVSTPIATAWLNDQAPLDGFAPYSQADFDVIIRALSISFPEVKSATFAKSVDNTYANAAQTS